MTQFRPKSLNRSFALKGIVHHDEHVRSHKLDVGENDQDESEGNVKTAMWVAREGLFSRRLTAPPATMRSKRPPMAMNTPPRKDLRQSPLHPSLALATPAPVMRHPICWGECPFLEEYRISTTS